MRTTKSVTISLPPAQLKSAERLARKQNRTMSELFREGLRRLEQEEEWRPSPVVLAQFGELVNLLRQDANKAGRNKIADAEIEAEVEAARKEMRGRTKGAKKRSGK